MLVSFFLFFYYVITSIQWSEVNFHKNVKKHHMVFGVKENKLTFEFLFFIVVSFKVTFKTKEVFEMKFFTFFFHLFPYDEAKKIVPIF